MVVVWLLGLRFAPRWAVPLALLAAAVVTVTTADGAVGSLAPAVELTAPTLT
ncbi:Benzoate membrane transport protein [Klenkia soli]|uniref:Benzoate membrane transport protein n=1 Tax=Klenkia soli TaxID=1052260 RepID=A0A1H0QTC2_9ACTN|nr:Benzoate membrane transport protein [Klenkia soli]